jgi:hypothetical protein
MFCEQMANNCIFRFQPYWNINQPKQRSFFTKQYCRFSFYSDEEQRIIRISRVFCDEIITVAANTVGVLLEELLNCLPGLNYNLI